MKPIAIAFSDLHLHSHNIGTCESIVGQILQESEKLKVPILFGGDWFDSRLGQPLQVLLSTREMVSQINNHSQPFYVIAGNHDKTDLNSKESYLDIYGGANFKVIDCFDTIKLGDSHIHMLPYFKENQTYVHRLEHLTSTINKDKANILLTHVAVNGAVNNDGTQVDNNLKISLFSPFDRVLIGHYHNAHKISEQIDYFGSACPKNFGEDNDKGLIHIYANGTWERKKLSFPQYHTIACDASEVASIVPEADNIHSRGDRLRIIISGEEAKLKSLNLSDISSIAKIEKRPTEIDDEIEATSEDFKTYNQDNILPEFEAFCKARKVNKTIKQTCISYF